MEMILGAVYSFCLLVPQAMVNVRYFLSVGVPHLPNGPAVWPLITFREGLDDQVSESVTEASKELKIRLM